MGNSFKDQFLKKGLVTQKQANKAINEKNVSRSKKRNKKTREDDEIQRRIQLARNEQAARNRELNRQRNEAAKEKEVQGQIRQIIKQNLIEVEGDNSFHFVATKLDITISGDPFPHMLCDPVLPFSNWEKTLCQQRNCWRPQ